MGGGIVDTNVLVRYMGYNVREQTSGNRRVRVVWSIGKGPSTLGRADAEQDDSPDSTRSISLFCR